MSLRGGGPSDGPGDGPGDQGEEPVNFLGYPPQEVDPHAARVVLLPVPYDGTASYRKGARLGPAAILTASHQLEDFDVELGWDASALGIHTAEDVRATSDRPEAVVDAVEKAAAYWAQGGRLVGVLGGEHTVAIGAVRALAREFDKLTVLFLDAHADMRDEYQGTRYSHACTARRVTETCDLVAVGVRSAERAEWDWARANHVPIFTWPPPPGTDLAAQVLSHLGENVYVSVDLDVLCSSLMPAVGNPEPGGMQWHELTGLLRAVAEKRRMVGFDVTELAPGPADSPAATGESDASSYAAAKLVYKIIGYALRSSPGRC